MLNIEKVKSMTKAAAYENGPEKKNIGIGHYFRGDYLGLQMVLSALAYTAAFCILVFLWAMGNIENLMLKISHAEYIQELVKNVSILFAAGIVMYEIAVYAYFSSKYQKAKSSLKEYRVQLNQIRKSYETQESAEDLTEVNLGTDEEKNI